MKKFNWGHGIIIGYVLFVGYILYFVFTSFGINIDLVSEDYYAQEIAYQDRIDDIENAKEWAGEVTIMRNDAGIEVRFSTEAFEDFNEGTVYCFRPSDVQLDRTFPLNLDENGSFTIPYQVLTSGRYDVQLKWQGKEKGYFIKKELLI